MVGTTPRFSGRLLTPAHIVEMLIDRVERAADRVLRPQKNTANFLISLSISLSFPNFAIYSYLAYDFINI